MIFVVIVIAVVSAVVFGRAVALVTVMHVLHAKPSRADFARVTDPDPGTAHCRFVGVRIVGVDLEKEKLALRLECGPSGDDLCAGFSFPQSLKYPISVDVGISDTGTRTSTWTATVTTTAVYLSVVLTWILIVSVIGMVVSVLFSRRTSEIAMLAYFGILGVRGGDRAQRRRGRRLPVASRQARAAGERWRRTPPETVAVRRPW